MVLLKKMLLRSQVFRILLVVIAFWLVLPNLVPAAPRGKQRPCHVTLFAPVVNVTYYVTYGYFDRDQPDRGQHLPF